MAVKQETEALYKAVPVDADIWKNADKKIRMGAPIKFKDGIELWDACVGYFEWVRDNPLWGQKIQQGVVVPDRIMRAMTLMGLCNHIGIHHDTWYNWKEKRPDLSETLKTVDSIIYQQKVELAAAGKINPQFIGKELGLVDKQEVTSTVNALVTSKIEINPNDDPTEALKKFEEARQKT